MSGERLTKNPFYVLEVSPSCSAMDAERQGQKLLGMLELGLDGARTYPTPLGPMERTPDDVRVALSEIRDPARRIEHELWARGAPCAETPAAGAQHDTKPDPWPPALAATGWRRA